MAMTAPRVARARCKALMVVDDRHETIAPVENGVPFKILAKVKRHVMLLIDRSYVWAPAKFLSTRGPEARDYKTISPILSMLR